MEIVSNILSAVHLSKNKPAFIATRTCCFLSKTAYKSCRYRLTPKPKSGIARSVNASKKFIIYGDVERYKQASKYHAPGIAGWFETAGRKGGAMAKINESNINLVFLGKNITIFLVALKKI